MKTDWVSEVYTKCNMKEARSIMWLRMGVWRLRVQRRSSCVH